MLITCVIDFKGDWDNHLPIIEFAYNNSYHSSIVMAPLEELYGIRYRSSMGWFKVSIGPELVYEAIEKFNLLVIGIRLLKVGKILIQTIEIGLRLVIGST